MRKTPLPSTAIAWYDASWNVTPRSRVKASDVSSQRLDGADTSRSSFTNSAIHSGACSGKRLATVLPISYSQSAGALARTRPSMIASSKVSARSASGSSSGGSAHFSITDASGTTSGALTVRIAPGPHAQPV